MIDDLVECFDGLDPEVLEWLCCSDDLGAGFDG